MHYGQLENSQLDFALSQTLSTAILYEYLGQKRWPFVQHSRKVRSAFVRWFSLDSLSSARATGTVIYFKMGLNYSTLKQF